LLIQIVRGETTVAPSKDVPGELIWRTEGGRGDSEEVGQLPGSVLSELFPKFEIGAWYRLDQAKQILGMQANPAPASSPEEEVWTEVPVNVPTVEGIDTLTVLMPKSRAALEIINRVLNFVEALDLSAGVWIRVE
jgi:hypothetical protein